MVVVVGVGASCKIVLFSRGGGAKTEIPPDLPPPHHHHPRHKLWPVLYSKFGSPKRKYLLLLITYPLGFDISFFKMSSHCPLSRTFVYTSIP